MLAEKRGFKWLGPFPQTVGHKTWWKCSNNHKWESRYHNISRGIGCPFCSNKAPKTAEDYRKLAKKENFEWLGEKLPKNVMTKTLWRCSNKHVWEAPWRYIQQGYGCLHCTGKIPKTIKDYHDLAAKRGFRWVGEVLPRAARAKTPWKCLRGHIWETSYSNIRSGSGCPDCLDLVNNAQVSKPQRRICEMLGGTLNYPCGSYRIDIALLDKMIAIEYDCWFWHGHKQEYDAKRDAFLLARHWKILHIKSDKDVPPQWKLDEAIAKLKSGQKKVEIILDDWEQGRTFVEARAQKKVDPWERGPIPISWDGGISFDKYRQLSLW